MNISQITRPPIIGPTCISSLPFIPPFFFFPTSLVARFFIQCFPILKKLVTLLDLFSAPLPVPTVEIKLRLNVNPPLPLSPIRKRSPLTPFSHCCLFKGLKMAPRCGGSFPSHLSLVPVPEQWAPAWFIIESAVSGENAVLFGLSSFTLTQPLHFPFIFVYPP